MLLFHVRCPKCKQVMKYLSRSKILTKKRKQCVYCNFSIDIRKNLTQVPNKTDFPGFKSA